MKRWNAVVGFLALALVAAILACGGDDAALPPVFSSTPTPTPTAQTTPRATLTPGAATSSTSPSPVDTPAVTTPVTTPAVTTPVATPVATPTPPPNAFRIKMVPSLTFDKDELTIPANTQVSIVAQNTETLLHSFAVYESRDAASAGAEAIASTPTCFGPCVVGLTVNLTPGEYFFRCDVHPLQMVGTLIVR